MERKTLITILLAIVVLGGNLFAQSPNVIQYINTYKLLAIQEMQRTGVPASIKLAQGILETEAGTSDLVKRSNNHFGIKCKNNWDGDKVYHDDDARQECFRAYSSAEDSYKDHSDFLKNSPRYAFLFKLDPEDYRGWAQGLRKAGYATNPKYTQQLIQYIEDYNLQTFTLIALGKKQWSDTMAFAAAGNQKTDNGTAFSSIPAIEIHPDAGAGADNSTQDESQAAPPVNYPSGEFRINNTRVIYAAAGSSLLALAEQYGIKYKHILEFNELGDGDDVLIHPQLIFIQRKRKQGATEFHVVQKLETVYDIAQKEGIRLESLLAYNLLQPDMQPAVGEKLFLQSYASQRPALEMRNDVSVIKPEEPKPTIDENKASTIKHLVQSRETLFSIAKKYEVKADQIKEWNNLQTEDIRIGQELIIYKN